MLTATSRRRDRAETRPGPRQPTPSRGRLLSGADLRAFAASLHRLSPASRGTPFRSEGDHAMYEEALTNVPLFASLSRRELTQLADACRERDYAPGDVLVRQGRSGMGLFILIAGSARVTCRRDDGVEGMLGRLAAGDVLGETALITAGHPTATVTAEAPVRAIVLPLWEFRGTLRE